jgi:hypothetical protein
MTGDTRAELLQGTLDLLILRVYGVNVLRGE